MSETKNETTRVGIHVEGRFATRSEALEMVEELKDDIGDSLKDVTVTIFFDLAEAATPSFLGELVRLLVVVEKADTIVAVQAQDRHVDTLVRAAKAYGVSDRLLFV